MKKLLWLFALLSCSAEQVPQKESDYWTDFTPFHAEYDPASLPGDLIQGQKTAIDTFPVDEVSGMVASRKYPGYAWVHTDSGNDPELILVRLADGVVLCRYKDNDIQNVDWEDIAAFQDRSGINWLVIGDIGDNLQQRNNLTLYYLEEPDYHDSLEGSERLVDFREQARHFVYPDGIFDAEALFMDPDRGDAYIITKRDSRSRVYGLPYKESFLSWDTAIFCGSFPFNGVTAADVKFDARILVIRTYLEIFTWHWEFGSDIRQVMAGLPNKPHYDQSEPQGEAITFSINDKSYYVLSEKLFGIAPVLYRWTYPY